MARRYQLVVQGGPAHGRYLELAGPVTIGRGADNALSLPGESQVSRAHARIELQGEYVVLTDLNSANGTVVNGQRIQGSVWLRPNDWVQLGGTTIFLQELSQPVAGSPFSQGNQSLGTPTNPLPEQRFGTAPLGGGAAASSVARGGSLARSLAALGIRFTTAQIVGVVVSLIAGIVVSRALPYLYPALDPVLTLFIGTGAGRRDTVNTYAMTLITFLTSFLIAYLAVRFFGSSPRSR